MIKERIAAYVEEKGLKQIYISQRTGLSPQAVSSLLRGERNLDVEEYAKLCDVLGVICSKQLLNHDFSHG